MGLRFEWDPQKAAQNKRKHTVSFEEATTQQRLLIVSFAERNSAIRIISARKLTASERKEYEEEF